MRRSSQYLASVSLLAVLFVSSSVSGTIPRVVLQLLAPGPFKAGDFVLSFQLLDTKMNVALTDADLRVTHTKKLHLFVYDAGLNEFRYVFPEFVGGRWQVALNLPTNGKYEVWCQATLLGDETIIMPDSAFQVVQGIDENPVPVHLGDVRTGEDHKSVVKLEDAKILSGRLTALELNFSRDDGLRPELTPFLGELADAWIVTLDGSQLIHVHPVDSGLPNQLILRAVFPTMGEYRLWIRYVDRGIAKLVLLSVIVSQ